jgi:two-component system, cell cycle sensor histidine kinase and response regulator CckA
MSKSIVGELMVPTSRWIPTRVMAVKIAVSYALLGGLWILGSGWLLHHFVTDPALEEWMENLKGWFFVGVTALLLGLALDRYFREIRRSARLLEASEQRWQFALKGAGQGVWDWNTRTNEVFFSSGLSSMLGFESHEFAETLAEWEARVHPADLPTVKAELQRHLEGQTPMYASEHRVRCKDGNFKWVLDRAKVMSLAPDDKALRVVGTHSDITERKQAEMALREAQERYRLLVESAPDAIFVLRGRQVAYINAAARHLLGATEASQLVGQGVEDRIHPDFRELVEQRLRQLIDEQKPVPSMEQKYLRLDGSPVEVEVSAVPASWEDQRGAVVFVRDITARKRLANVQEFLAQTAERSDGFFRALARYLAECLELNFVCIDRLLEDNLTAQPLAVYGNGAFQDNAAYALTDTPCGEVVAGGMCCFPQGVCQLFPRDQVLRDLRAESYAGTVLRGSGGRPVGLIAVIGRQPLRDPELAKAVLQMVSGRAAIELERQESEAQLRRQLELQDQIAKIATTVPGMIYSFRLRPDGSACMPFAAPVIEDLWGLRPGDVSDDFSLAMASVHPDDVTRLAESINESARTMKAWREVFRVRHPRKGEVWLEGQSVPRREPDGSTLWHGFVQDVTERKRKNTALRESEARYRLLAENVEDFVSLHDAQGNRLYVSPSFCRVTGWTAEEVMESAWDARLHPDEVPLIQQSRTQNLAGQTTLTEHRIRCRDGSWMWVEARCKPIVGPDGQVTQLLIWQHDITQRKRAEELVKMETNRRRILFEEATDGIVVLGQNLGVIEANRSFAQMLGYASAQEVLPLHPWDWDAIYTTRENLLAVWPELPSSPLTFTTKFRRKDGTVLDVEITSNPAEWAGQKLLFNHCRDITDRKRTEALLQESLLFRRQAEKIGRIGAWKVSPQTDYLYWTEGVYAIVEAPLEYKPGLEEGMKFYDAESIPVLHEALKRALADGTPFVVEAGVTTTTGKHLWTEVRGLGRIGDDEQAFIMGTFQDITERKHLESQLRQAQKLEAIGQLAGGVAHDFNNILAAIMMHLGLLQMNPDLDDRTRHALKDLDAGARRAANLTRQLLMFSRRSVLKVKPLDVNEVVETLLKMLRRLIGEQIDLRFDGKSALPLVEADAGMLEQVIMNLVVNARDALPKGGRITITTTPAEVDAIHTAAHPNSRPGRFVCLAVSDTGCGMDAATLKRIFEPFFTTKDAGKGTGLGLATVHGIVAQHKGWVEVDSELTAGTEFRVFLPVTTQASVEVIPAPQTGPVRRGRETILLVEDEPPVRLVVGQSLRALGYQVYEAANGQEAVKLWQIHGAQVALLLTDMVMPEGMTGLELVEQLQALKPGLKAIISSGYSAEIVNAGVPSKAGIVYLPKPYATKVLADTIRDCLDQKK